MLNNTILIISSILAIIVAYLKYRSDNKNKSLNPIKTYLLYAGSTLTISYLGINYFNQNNDNTLQDMVDTVKSSLEDTGTTLVDTTQEVVKETAEQVVEVAKKTATTTKSMMDINPSLPNW